MKKAIITNILLISVAAMLLGGCQDSQRTNSTLDPVEKIDTRKIGDTTTISGFLPIQLKGYGLVTGLAGTGSSECPADIKNYLIKYIKVQLPTETKINPENLISSKNTAVVSILGLLPAGASEGEKFDVIISSLTSTQTTSLAGGRLMPAELKQTGNVNLQTEALAKVEGAVFIDSSLGENVGFILNGAESSSSVAISLQMNQPDYILTSTVRDTINDKFSKRVAVAVSERQINLSLPKDYIHRKRDFIGIIKNLHIEQTGRSVQLAIEDSINDLRISPDKKTAQYSLSGIGKPAAKQLISTLNSNNDNTKLAAAATLLNINDYQGYQPLTDFAFNGTKEQKLKAMDAIAQYARRKDASGVLARLLSDNDIDVKLNAYHHLRRFEDLAISTSIIHSTSGSFELSRLVQGRSKLIWAARSGQPAIAIFGAPIYCSDNIFIQSADSSVMINSPAGQNQVTMVRTHPRTGEVIKIECSNELGSVISHLCRMPMKSEINGKTVIHSGLGLSYSQAIDLIEIMIEKDALDAKLILGPEPELKKSLSFK